MAKQLQLGGQMGTTPISNQVLDFLLPLLPEPDMRALLYAYRRLFGYQEPRAAQAEAISLREFVEGRRTSAGVPIDLGTGIARSSVQFALQRLTNACILRVVEHDLGGRRSIGQPSGNRYVIHLDPLAWMFIPYIRIWNWSDLGRYVVATTHGALPEPDDLELGLLIQALRKAAKPAYSPIELPAVWPNSGLITPTPRRFGGEPRPDGVDRGGTRPPGLR